MKTLKFIIVLIFTLSLCSVHAQTKCEFPSITFTGTSVALSDNAKTQLQAVAATLKENADSMVVVKMSNGTTKAMHGLCMARLNKIRLFLNEHEGISADRVRTMCMSDYPADPNTADLTCVPK